MPIIYPSLLAADPLMLGLLIKELDDYAYGYHIDIMDFHFVPNLTFGLPMVNAIARATRRPLWLHLMVDDPLRYFDHLHMPSGTMITVHSEIKGPMAPIIQAIGTHDWLAGLALNPMTPIDAVFAYADNLDHVLIMSVNSGFSGQQFMPSVLEKVDSLREYRTKNNLSFKIGIDGGISAQQLPLLKEKGVDYCAIGSAVFNQGNPIKKLRRMHRLAA